MGGDRGRGKFKSKPTRDHHFSTPEEIAAAKPQSFNEDEEESEHEHSVKERSKRKGTQGVIQIENPNLVKAKNVKAQGVDMDRPAELSRREREELQKQTAHERYMKLQEQGRTEQSRKDLDRLALVRLQRLEATTKREEEKAAKATRQEKAAKARN